VAHVPPFYQEEAQGFLSYHRVFMFSQNGNAVMKVALPGTIGLPHCIDQLRACPFSSAKILFSYHRPTASSMASSARLALESSEVAARLIPGLRVESDRDSVESSNRVRQSVHRITCLRYVVPVPASRLRNLELPRGFLRGSTKVRPLTNVTNNVVNLRPNTCDPLLWA